MPLKRLPAGTRFIPQNRRNEDGTIIKGIAKYFCVDKNGNALGYGLVYKNNLRDARKQVLFEINNPNHYIN